MRTCFLLDTENNINPDIKVHEFIRINIISCSFSFKLCLFDNVCKYLIYSKLSTNSRFNLPCITTILYIHSSIFKIQSKSSPPNTPKKRGPCGATFLNLGSRCIKQNTNLQLSVRNSLNRSRGWTALKRNWVRNIPQIPLPFKWCSASTSKPISIVFMS